MKTDSNDFHISPFDFYLLRTPLESINSIFEFHNKLNTEPLSILLKQVFNDKILQEAIYLASVDLYNTLNEFLDKTSYIPIDKVQLSLYKYYLRMGARCTPYGLFAGSLTGQISTAETKIVRDNLKFIKKVSRLDINCINALQLFIKEKYRHKLSYFPNNSIYKVYNRIRYIETSWRNGSANYDLSSVDNSEYLEVVLEKAKKGSTIEELVISISDSEITQEEALLFIDELIDCQLLVSLEPIISGNNYLDSLIDKTEKLISNDGIIAQLHDIKELLLKEENKIVNINKIKNILEGIIPQFSSPNLVQIDVNFKNIHNNINSGFTKQIGSDIEKLYSISKKRENPALLIFIEQFKKRYGEKEISLSLALDVESGIGYGQSNENMIISPLIDDIQGISRQINSTKSEWTSIDHLKLNLLLKSIKEQTHEVTITDDDIKKFRFGNSSELAADSIYLLGTLVLPQEDITSTDQEPLLLLRACGGTSAVNLMARFGNDNEALVEKLKEIIKTEEAGANEIYAEIVHLPYGRVGNVLMRPDLRTYEIPFLAGSEKDEEHQIRLNDLFISIRSNQIVLRSKRLNRQIIPKMANAHNFVLDKTVVYKFLCDLQYQNLISGINWDWGPLIKEDFLPRVRLGRIIVSRARWLLTDDDIKGIDLKNHHLVLERALALREKNKIPEHVLLVQGEHELLICFSSIPALLILFNELKKYKSVELTEFLEFPDRCLVKDQHGQSFTNEVIIPFKKAKTSKLTEAPINSLNIEENSNINFDPGSAWVYFKIYAGPITLEMLLTQVIRPLINELISEHIIEKAFFIRYKDPDSHLRLRFFNSTNTIFWKICFERLLSVLKEHMDAGIVQKMHHDVYEREYERYGLGTISHSESIFFYDSLAVLDFLNLVNNSRDKEKKRWQFALLGVHEIFNDFGYDLNRKHNLSLTMRETFYKEFAGKDKRLNHSLNDKFRVHEKDIEPLFTSTDSTSLIQILRDRSTKVSESVKVVREAYQSTPEKLDNMVGSYIHMFLNRLFLNQARAHELVLYHFLMKYYKSQLVRKDR